MTLGSKSLLSGSLNPVSFWISLASLSAEMPYSVVLVSDVSHLVRKTWACRKPRTGDGFGGSGAGTRVALIAVDVGFRSFDFLVALDVVGQVPQKQDVRDREFRAEYDFPHGQNCG